MSVIPVNLPVVKPPFDEEINPQNLNQIRDQIHEELRNKQSDTDKVCNQEDATYQNIKQGTPLTSEHLQKVIQASLRNSPETADVKVKVTSKSGDLSHVFKETRKASFEKSKKILETFKEKTENYPKYISHEASTVLCVLISIGESESINLNSLPSEDKELILSMLTENMRKAVTANDYEVIISIEFDESKDFILRFKTRDDGKVEKLYFFNTVIHPAIDKNKDLSIPIENDGDKIAVGGTIVLNKKNIQKLGGIESKRGIQYTHEEKEYSPSRQPVAGRNAYEIRADVLQMAIDWARTEESNIAYVKPTDEALLALAKKFYSFVEKR